jgi:hypothetical protein
MMINTCHTFATAVSSAAVLSSLFKLPPFGQRSIIKNIKSGFASPVMTLKVKEQIQTIEMEINDKASFISTSMILYFFTHHKPDVKSSKMLEKKNYRFKKKTEASLARWGQRNNADCIVPSPANLLIRKHMQE